MKCRMSNKFQDEQQIECSRNQTQFNHQSALQQTGDFKQPNNAASDQLGPRTQAIGLPAPNPSASYVSLDGLTLVIIFDKAVNLSSAIESVEQRRASAEAPANYGEPSTQQQHWIDPKRHHELLRMATPREEEGGAQSPVLSPGYSATGNMLPKNRLGFSQKRIQFVQGNATRFGGHKSGLQTSQASAIAHFMTSHQPEKLSGRRSTWPMCQAYERELGNDTSNLELTPYPIDGVQICAQLLSKKTLRLLRKYRLHNCIWISQVQFIIQLGRPVTQQAIDSLNAGNQQGPTDQASSVRVSFQKNTISASQIDPAMSSQAPTNDRELSVELNKLPLESLGVPLAPRLALTGPNQVPACGQFALNAHLSSPFGTQPNESIKLHWSVQRLGLIAPSASNQSSTRDPIEMSPNVANAGQSVANEHQLDSAEQRWRKLLQLVESQQGSNNLILEAGLLQLLPQLYEFRLQATFATSLTSVQLNASHQVGRLDFDAPIGTIYGSHLLSQEQQFNTNQELALIADIQVPECAQNVKQVSLYWQVQDPRIRFEQTYGPIYLARANTLPEQAQVEFRLNLFYGIRVKRFASTSVSIPTGDSTLDAQISDGLLMASVGKSREDRPELSDDSRSTNGGQLELYAISHDEGVRRQQQQQQQLDKYTYQWSCFDGKTAQQCQKSLKLQASSNGTRYELGQQQRNLGQALQLSAAKQQQVNGPSADGQANHLLLVDKPRQRQSVLRIPMNWLDSDAQLWFGLQRFDRHNPSQHSRTEYALVSVHESQPTGLISIGPILIGRSRHRASLRNPLTGAMILIAQVPTIIVGRLGSGDRVGSFRWQIANYAHPLHWTARNATNPFSGQQELVTELHLNPNLLIAHGQHHVQLVSCSRQTGHSSEASLSLDIVQGLSGCKVALRKLPSDNLRGGALAQLVVSVDYCNIPVGLSPISYQLYLIDTSASDGFMEASRQRSSSTTPQNSADDDYLNEADEIYLESQAQPISVPQLSPVFLLGSHLNGAALMALLNREVPSAGVGQQQSAASTVRIRFGAKVCDRLQGCRMFYSNSINPLIDFVAIANVTIDRSLQSSASASNQPLALEQQANANLIRGNGNDPSRHSGSSNSRQSLGMLKGMIDSARRSNLAGNSIAAISILNGVLTLGQRALDTSTKRLRDRSESSNRNSDATNEPLDQGKNRPQTLEDEEELQQVEDQLKDLLRIAMRDCLQFGLQSIKRQFHYTESGQSNIVLSALSNILTSPLSGFEFRFHSLRLVDQLIRRTVEQSTTEGGSASSFKVIDSLPDMNTIRRTFEALFATFNQHHIESSYSFGHQKPILNGHQSSSSTAHNKRKQPPPIKSVDITASVAPSNSISAFLSSPTATQTNGTIIQASNNANRRKREEVILAFLSKIRQAHRSLLQASAMQLPLGAIEQLEYQVTSGSLSADDAIQAGADIVSSLTHQTDLTSDVIEVDLHGFGAISINFDKNQQLFSGERRFQQDLSNSRLRCRNDTMQTRCSSFVLAVSTFAGKAPFRSLDPGPGLRVPVLQVDWLSPIDGTNLIEIMKNEERLDLQDILHQTGHQRRRLQPSDFQATVTFVVPWTSENSGNDTNYKCYQFEEDSNEWVQLRQQRQQTDPDNQTTDEKLEGERRVRCSFRGFGIVGAFQQEPPPIERPTELTIAIGVASVIGLVALISLFGCVATQFRQSAARKNNSL